MMNRSVTVQSGLMWNVLPGVIGVKSMVTDWKNVLVFFSNLLHISAADTVGLAQQVAPTA